MRVDDFAYANTQRRKIVTVIRPIRIVITAGFSILYLDTADFIILGVRLIFDGLIMGRRNNLPSTY